MTRRLVDIPDEEWPSMSQPKGGTGMEAKRGDCVVRPDEPVGVLKHADAVCRTDSTEWLPERNTGIGGTVAAHVYRGGARYGKSVHDLWAEMTGLVEAKDISDVPAVKWGRVMEPHIAAAYAEETGAEIIKAGHMYRSRERPWQIGTPDYFEMRGGELWVVEVKLWSYADLSDGVPDKALDQTLHYADLVGAVGVVVVIQKSWHSDPLWRREKVEDHQETIRGMRASSLVFWDLVQSETPPEPDGTEETKKALGRIWPDSDGELVDLSSLDVAGPKWEDIDGLRQEAVADESDAKERRNWAESALRQAIGEKSGCVLPDGTIYTLSKQEAFHEAKEAHIVKSRVLRRRANKEDS